tara:strand:- start:248 stop:667 length:420 start_codon:yes stop_codon:yes gene_type:complete
METHSIDRNSMIVIIKGKTLCELYYQILPHTVYTGNELFPYEDKSLFKHLNIDEEHFDLIIIGKKVMKQQIDTIKNEILQKTVCSIQHVIFEYEELLDDTIEVQFDYHNITINGTRNSYTIQYLFKNNNWIEINQNIIV